MIDDPKLLEIQKLLPNFFSYFKDDNILAISDTKDTLPFMFIINDDGYEDCLLISIAVDYANSINVAEILITTQNISEILLSEVFYISHVDGSTHFGQSAYDRWDFETLKLKDLDPPTKSVH